MKKSVILDELVLGDKYTRRARPSLIYFGLLVIFLNYCFVPLIQLLSGVLLPKPFELPAEFWWAWGGVVGTWSVGRSTERIKTKSKQR